MSLEITRLFDFPYFSQKKYNLKNALVTKYGDKWVSTSSEEYINKANTISRALLRLGVKANDKIAVISTTNRTEWNIVDIGILQTGAQNVPIYPTISKEDYFFQFPDKCLTELENLNKELQTNFLPALITRPEMYELENCKSFMKMIPSKINMSPMSFTINRRLSAIMTFNT